MTTYNNALVVYDTGKLQKIQSTDDVGISGNVSIGGNLNVTGTITSGGTVNALVNSPFVDLGIGYTNTVTPRSSGLAANIKAATGFSALTVSDFVAGVVATSAPKFTVSAGTASTLSAGDIIQVSGSTEPANDGLFIVAGVSGSDVSVYGVGGTAVPAYTLFCQNQFAAGTSETATVVKVDLGIVAIADGVSIKDDTGTAITLGKLTRAYYSAATVSNFNGTGPGTGYVELAAATGSVTLQGAYNAGNTIDMTNGRPLHVSAPLVGTAAIILDANAASRLQVTGANATVSTITSGDVVLSSVGGILANATGTRSNLTVTNERLDLISTGARAGGTQVLVQATNSAGASQVVVEADSIAIMQTATGAGAKYYFESDAAAATPFVAMEAESNTAGIYIGSTPHNSFVAIGTDGVRNISIGNANGASALVVNAGTGGMTFDTTSGGGISIDAVGAASNFSVTGANLTLSTITSGTLALSSAGAATFDAAGALSINSSGGALSLGNNANAYAINIGTGAAARVITIGNTTGASQLVLYSGSGAIQATGNLTLTGWLEGSSYLKTGSVATISLPTPSGAGGLIFDSTVSKMKYYDGVSWVTIASGGSVTLQHAYDGGQTIALSGTTGDLAISVGSGSAAVTIDTNKASYFKVTGGNLSLQTVTSGALDLTSAGTLDIDAVGALQINSSAGAISIGNDAVSQNISIGTAGTRTLALGSSAATVHIDAGAGSYFKTTTGDIVIETLDTSGTVGVATLRGYNFMWAGVRAGPDEGAIYFDYTLKTMYLGGAGASTGWTLNMGTEESSATVNLGTNGTKLVTIGSVSSTSATTINAGTGTLDINSAAAITVDGTGISIDGTSASNLSVTGANLTVSTITSGLLTVQSADGLTMTATGQAKLDSTGSTIDIGSGANNYDISIGSGGSRTIKVGSVNAPVMLGSTSAAAAAMGTYLPVGASSGLTKGEVLYVNSSGQLALADGDGTGTREVIGVALENAGSGAGDLKVATVPGSVVWVTFASAPAGGDVSKPVYLSTTAGQATMTAPVTGRVYRLGILVSSTPDADGNYKLVYLPSFVADL